MRVGTKSLLFGTHQFALHPLFVAIAWWKVYGFPWDPRLWLCFLVHDWGYWGKPNMDGPEGETHPELGARIVQRLCDPEWGTFCLLHSRFYAKRQGRTISRLCVADKAAVMVTPWWLQIVLGSLSGEIKEYMHPTSYQKANGWRGYPQGTTKRQWVKAVRGRLVEFLQREMHNAESYDCVARRQHFRWLWLDLSFRLMVRVRRWFCRSEAYGWCTDLYPVECGECLAVMRRKNCVRTYVDDGTGEDVFPVDECPRCGAQM